MEVIVKFAVYNDHTSQQKRTTFRVRQTENGYIIERYANYKFGWQIISHTYLTLDTLFDSPSFQSLFIQKNNIS